MDNKVTSLTVQVKGDIADLSSKLATIKTQFSGLMGDKKFGEGISAAFKKMESALEDLQTRANSPLKTEASFRALLTDIGKNITQIEQLDKALQNISKLSSKEKLRFLPPDTTKEIRAAISALEAYKKELDKIARSIETQQKKVDTAEVKMNAAKAKQSSLNREAGGYKANVTKKQNALDSARSSGASPEKIQELEAALQQAQAKEQEFLETHAQAIADAQKDVEKYTEAYQDQVRVLGEYEKKLGAIHQLYEEGDEKPPLVLALENLRERAQSLGIDWEDLKDKSPDEQFEALSQRIEACTDNAVKPFTDSIQDQRQQLDGYQKQLESTKNSVNACADAEQRHQETQKKSQSLLNKIKQFTGLAGAAMAARKILQDSIQTIKELDAQMTQMAVVTDESVGGYWDQLPEYTARANALGVSIKSAYEAATLYYQQGLKTNEVVDVSNSTLKMARIAGLNAAEATDRMTAALRGFNMEITQTNADRVADVYSKLAAITASNVDEISTAMTKTASIASSAGMQFETTAAFLSQIIETTRESAETAGTALKTVIARFQELKKDPSEIGEVDGEIVDANKIETALRSVGVALRDAGGQFRQLDEVFLELSGKWKDLDTNTQRYIATIAAGSRQQSRFIAMMSDYSRTTELVSAANNAAGTSNEQFEKTLESLEAKLARLKNSWHTFTMGIANSKVIKVGIDLLQKLLDVINKITQGWDSTSSEILKTGMLVTAFALLTAAAKSFHEAIRGGQTALGAFGTVGSQAMNIVLHPVTTIKNALSNLNAKLVEMNLKAGEGTGANATLAASFQRVQQEASTLALAINGMTAEEGAMVSVDGVSIAATEAKAKAVEDYCSKLGLSASETAMATSLTAGGVPVELAAKVAKFGLNKELEEEIRNREDLSDAQKQNLLDQGKNIAGDNAEAASKKLKNKELKKSSGNFKELGKSAGKMGLAILIVAAAIAVLAVSFWALKKNSPEGRLKTAKQELTNATNAAKKADERFNNLNSTLQDLGEKTKALDDLKKGTKEWRDAVEEINSEVSDLIDKYPELAAFYEVNKDGVMTIKEGQEAQVDAILQKADNERKQAKAAELAAKQRELAAENQAKFAKLSDAAVAGRQDDARAARAAVDIGAASVGAGAGAAAGALVGSGFAGIGAAPGAVVGAIVGGIGGLIAAEVSGAGKAAYEEVKTNQEADTKALAEKLAKGELRKGNTHDIREWLMNERGMSSEKATQWIQDLSKNNQAGFDELKRYGQQLVETEQQSNLIQEQIAQAARDQIDRTNMTQEESDIVDAQTNGEFVQTSIDSFNEDLQKKINGDKNYLKNDDDYNEWVKATYGDEAKIGENGKITYKDGNGKKQTVSGESAVEQYGAARGTSNAASKSQVILDISSKVDDATKKLLKDNTGGNLTQAEAKAAKENLKALNAEIDAKVAAKEITEDQAKAMKETNRKAIELNEQGFKGLADRMKANTTAAFSQTFMSAVESLDYDAAKALSVQFEKVYSTAGEEGANELSDLLTAMMSTYADDAETQATIIQKLAGANWSDVDSLEGVKNELSALGVELDESVVNLIDRTKELTNATTAISLDALNEKIKKVNTTINNLHSGEQGRIFDEDSYKALVDSNKGLSSSFKQLSDGTYILVSATNRLADAMEKNLIEQASKSLNQEVAGQQLQNYLNTVTIDPNTDHRAYIQTLVESGAVNLDAGIVEGLSSNSPVDTLSDEKIEEIWNNMYAYKTKEFDVSGKMDAVSRAYESKSGSELSTILGTALTKAKETGSADSKALVAGIAGAIENKALAANVDAETLSKLTDATRQFMNGDMNAFDGLTKVFNTITTVVDYWQPMFNRVYQLSERADALAAARNAKEEEYEEMIENEGVTIKQINDNLQARQDLIMQERAAIQAQLSEAKSDLETYLNAGGEFKDMLEFDNDTGLYHVKEGYESMANQQGLSNFLEGANNLAQVIIDGNQRNKELIKEYKKNQKAGMDSYNNMLSSIREGLINQKQAEIDKLSDINDAINDAQQKLAEKIQEQIDEARQARDNADTETDLADKQARIDALMREGGNELEILTLQKELDDATRDYQDKLVDQQMDAMEAANQAAADQRQQQIDIASAQLEYWKNNESWQRAADKLNEYYAASDEVTRQELGGKLMELLHGEDWVALTEQQKKDQTEQWQQELLQGSQYYNTLTTSLNNNSASIATNAKVITESATKDTQTYINKLDADKKEAAAAQIKRDNNLDNVSSNTNAIKNSVAVLGKTGNESLIDNAKIANEKAQAEAAKVQRIAEAKTALSNATKLANLRANDIIDEDGNVNINNISKLKTALEKAGYDVSQFNASDWVGQKITEGGKQIFYPYHAYAVSVKGKNNFNWDDLKNNKNDEGYIRNDGSKDNDRVKLGGGNNSDAAAVAKANFIKENQAFYYEGARYVYHDGAAYQVIDVKKWDAESAGSTWNRFATGGLADFTGPAWMDGTASAPELVLNARDTQNFIALKDVLASFIQNAAGAQSSIETTNGDAYIDVDINVDTLSSDYDVDEVARRVEDIINQDARYRNVTNAKTSR